MRTANPTLKAKTFIGLRGMMSLEACVAATSWVLAAALTGCSTPHADLGDVPADVEWRSGHSLGSSEPGVVLIPGTVTLEDGLSEDEAVTLALWNNAVFQEALADLGLSRAELVQAGMLPNPTLSMLFPVGAKPLELTAKYPLEAFWLRPRRLTVAKLDYDRTARRLVQGGLDLIRDVRLACADHMLANERHVLSETSVKLSQGIAGQAEARLRAGEASELEVANARIDVLQAQEQLARTSQDARLTRERLRFLAGLGAGQWNSAFQAAPIPLDFPLDLGVLRTNALAARPDLRAAELGLEAEGKRVGLARAEVYALTGSINAKDVGTDFLAGPGLDISIPIFNQNQGGIAQAKARFDKAARHYVTVRDRILFEVEEAHARLAQALGSFEKWRKHILPPLEESAMLAARSYGAGNVTYLFMLENDRKLSDAGLKAAEAAAELRRARAELERAAGQRLTGDPAN